jgi:hypothetical protein
LHHLHLLLRLRGLHVFDSLGFWLALLDIGHCQVGQINPTRRERYTN